MLVAENSWLPNSATRDQSLDQTIVEVAIDNWANRAVSSDGRLSVLQLSFDHDEWLIAKLRSPIAEELQILMGLILDLFLP